MTAKDPFDPPGPPGQPDVIHVDADHVRLKWTPPTDDGGSSVTGYVIERYEKRGGGDWAPCLMARYSKDSSFSKQPNLLVLSAPRHLCPICTRAKLTNSVYVL